MDHYLEFTILPDTEISGAHILEALFGKLHLALAGRGAGDVGVSFPDADMKSCRVGTRLRLHGTREALEALATGGWVAQFRDYAAISQILPVPVQVQHRSIFRVQEKGSNPERLRRRAMKRHGLSAEEAAKCIPDTARKRLSLPSLQMGSRSSGQQFRLFFGLGPLEQKPRAGTFSTYGFSRSATVPWF